ncbi:hypothetical protein GQ53DRAFT_369603 [Thozetella sp. PMI_491]|nr:hypothetical protein GQ53DRAFT_369603 [Thozetella sp. PMI_491]
MITLLTSPSFLSFLPLSLLLFRVPASFCLSCQSGLSQSVHGSQRRCSVLPPIPSGHSGGAGMVARNGPAGPSQPVAYQVLAADWASNGVGNDLDRMGVFSRRALINRQGLQMGPTLLRASQQDRAVVAWNRSK